jgi:hypothetical protein
VFLYSFAWHNACMLLFTKLLTLFFLWCIDCKALQTDTVHQNTFLTHTHSPPAV